MFPFFYLPLPSFSVLLTMQTLKPHRPAKSPSTPTLNLLLNILCFHPFATASEHFLPSHWLTTSFLFSPFFACVSTTSTSVSLLTTSLRPASLTHSTVSALTITHPFSSLYTSFLLRSCNNLRSSSCSSLLPYFLPAPHSTFLLLFSPPPGW